MIGSVGALLRLSSIHQIKLSWSLDKSDYGMISTVSNQNPCQ